MNLEKNKKTIMFLIFYTVILVFALINIDKILALLNYLLKILSPFIIGCFIAFILNVLLNNIENKLFKKLNEKNSKIWAKIKRPLSLTLSLLIIIGVIAIIFILIIPELANTINIFTNNLDNYKNESLNFLNNFGISDSQIKDFFENLLLIKDDIISYLSQNKESIISGTIGVASTILGTITNITIGIVFALYILVKKEDLQRQVKEITKAYLPNKKRKKLEEISHLSFVTFSNFITGQVTEAFIIGILCFIGMLILNIPYSGAISALVGFTALIPVFGAFIGTIIGAFLILMVSPIKAIIFVLFIIILQQIEGNLIYPKVVGKSVGLPGIWVLVAVTIGASIGGIFGMLISVPLCSVIYSLIKTSVKEKNRPKH